MDDQQKHIELVNLILEDEVDKKSEKEEILHLLVQSRVTKNVSSQHEEAQSFGDRMADSLAKFAGSWTFILLFLGILLLWIVINAVMLAHPYDPYPFILLNLILSCVAAIQAPVIMMSQNRQEEKDRMRSLNDYKTNLKSEIIIEDLHEKLDHLLANQEKLLQRMDKLEKKTSSPHHPQ